jgi:LysR family transcriptional regulator, hypochlorite-specific transcription factor HypT
MRLAHAGGIVEISWLDDFLALAQTSSFSRAATLRAVTQPAFSRRIRALESWVGTPLFDRATHRVTLTDAGERFRGVAEEVLRRLAQGREETRAAAAGSASTLTFAATHALSLTFFPAWLRSLEATEPLGPIRLVSDSMAACERILSEGRAQFLLCHHHAAAPGPFDGAAFRSLVVGSDVLAPMTAPDAARRPLASLPGRATAPVTLLAYAPESGLGRILAAALALGGRDAWLRPVFTSQLATVLRAMARDGRGVAWLPVSLVAEDLERGDLVRAGDESWDVRVELRLYRSSSSQSAAAERFWERAGGGR